LKGLFVVIAMVQLPVSYLIHVPRYDVFHLTMDTFPSFISFTYQDTTCVSFDTGGQMFELCMYYIWVPELRLIPRPLVCTWLKKMAWNRATKY